MSILVELYILFQPLINFLGTVCLIVLAAASTLYAVIWFVKKIWKFVLAVGVLTVLVVSMGLVLGTV